MLKLSSEFEKKHHLHINILDNIVVDLNKCIVNHSKDYPNAVITKINNTDIKLGEIPNLSGYLETCSFDKKIEFLKSIENWIDNN